jgi:hypothetical protein
MYALTRHPLAILVVLVMLMRITSLGSVAQETPVEEATPTSRANLPAEFCTAAQIATGDAEIVESPLSGAEVDPWATPGRQLYLLVLTLPPDSCVGYSSHYLHDGAIVWLVQEGQIEFATQPIAGLPPAIVGASDENGTPIAISGPSITLGAGDWVKLDRAAEYSYRNAGTEPAVVLMAVNEVDPFGGYARSCKGGCRKR